MARGKKTGRPGQPTKLTPKIQAAIVDHVRNGTPQKYAALAVGIKEATLKDWINRGRKQTSGIFSDFSNALRDAYGEFIASNVKVIQRAADGVTEETTKERTDKDGSKTTEKTKKKVFEWAAAAWLLERRAQEDFSNAKAELAIIKKQLIANNALLEKLQHDLREATQASSEATVTSPPPAPLVGGEANPESI